MNLGIEDTRGTVEAAEAPLSLWEQLAAFRELLGEGERLLGEVLVFTRSAEQSAETLQREKAQLDAEREALWLDRQRFMDEARQMKVRVQEQDNALHELKSEMGGLREELQGRPMPSEGEARLLDLERRLRGTEEELRQTRQILFEERERRNRAIALIRPLPPRAPAALATPERWRSEV